VRGLWGRLLLVIFTTALAAAAVLTSHRTSWVWGKPGSEPGIHPDSPGQQVVEGSYIVVLKDSFDDVDNVVNDMKEKHGLKAKHVYKHAIRGFAAPMPEAALNGLRNDPRVDYIEEDSTFQASDTQSSPPSWGLDRVDQQSLPLDYKFSTPVGQRRRRVCH